jgi:RHS repeat-associated protein
MTQTVGNNAAGNVNSFSQALGQVTSLTYNQAGRLATTSGSAGKITQYTYDAFGHRLVKVGAATATSIYSYDAQGHLLQETDDLGGTRVDYIYLDDRPVATIQPSNNAIYFLHDDRLGTPQRATNSSQGLAWTTKYQPFGQTSTLPALIVQDLRFPGQENDLETGLYHNGFRDYAPTLGRYLESDPIGLAGSSNTYAYVGDNPSNQIDPAGLLDWGSVAVSGKQIVVGVGKIGGGVVLILGGTAAESTVFGIPVGLLGDSAGGLLVLNGVYDVRSGLMALSQTISPSEIDNPTLFTSFIPLVPGFDNPIGNEIATQGQQWVDAANANSGDIVKLMMSFHGRSQLPMVPGGYCPTPTPK